VQRLERLINLVAALLDTTVPLSAAQIATRVPGYAEDKVAFRRAFERDKETLREMGVPITVEPVPASDPPVDGYRVSPEDYYLPDPGFAEDELAALHLAAAAVRLDGANGLAALWKLGGAVAEDGPPPVVAALPGAAHLGELFTAIAERRRVTLHYRDQPRHLDPHRLAYRDGHWYLAATDVDKVADRWFRLDRAGTLEALGSPGSATSRPERTEARPPPPWAVGGESPVHVRLLVDADQAGWAAGQLGAEAIVERRGDASLVFEVPVTNREAFRSFVLGFLDHAEVLSPPEVRDDLLAWLTAVTGESRAPSAG